MARTRLVPLVSEVEPPVVFTDDACDPGCTTVGAVLFQKGVPPRYFGLTVPPRVASSLRTGTSYQVVGKPDIIHVLIARQTWGDFMKRRIIL